MSRTEEVKDKREVRWCRDNSYEAFPDLGQSGPEMIDTYMTRVTRMLCLSLYDGRCNTHRDVHQGVSVRQKRLQKSQQAVPLTWITTNQYIVYGASIAFYRSPMLEEK